MLAKVLVKIIVNSAIHSKLYFDLPIAKKSIRKLHGTVMLGQRSRIENLH